MTDKEIKTQNRQIHRICGPENLQKIFSELKISGTSTLTSMKISSQSSSLRGARR